MSTYSVRKRCKMFWTHHATFFLSTLLDVVTYLSLTRSMSWWNRSTCSKLALSVTEKTMRNPSPVLMYCSLIALNSSWPAVSSTVKMETHKWRIKKWLLDAGESLLFVLFIYFFLSETKPSDLCSYVQNFTARYRSRALKHTVTNHCGFVDEVEWGNKYKISKRMSLLVILYLFLVKSNKVMNQSWTESLFNILTHYYKVSSFFE